MKDNSDKESIDDMIRTFDKIAKDEGYGPIQFIHCEICNIDYDVNRCPESECDHVKTTGEL